MLLIVLSGVLVAVIGGCACVVWASRGGPRWARGVATATLAAGELARKVRLRSNGSNGTGNSGVTGDS